MSVFQPVKRNEQGPCKLLNNLVNKLLTIVTNGNLLILSIKLIHLIIQNSER